jgi:hypothetical protein
MGKDATIPTAKRHWRKPDASAENAGARRFFAACFAQPTDPIQTFYHNLFASGLEPDLFSASPIEQVTP